MPICPGCQQPIVDSSITALDRSWHSACFRCTGCGQPISQHHFFPPANQPYHEACFHARFSPRCAIRGEILRQEYTINSWGETYCKPHAAGVTECFSCHRPVCERLTGGGVRYADGRTVCNRCRRTAIDDAAVGQPLVAQVRATLARLGLDLAAAATPLRLVDQGELIRRSTKPYTPKPAGMACHQWVSRNGQIIERSVEAILILHGLPAEHCAAIAAHELTHSYLFLHAFPDLEPVVEEGLCELTAYLWLKQQGTVEAAYRMKTMEENTDPVYGRGFQAARRGMEQIGAVAMFSYVFRHRRFLS
ncbi:MAG: protein DA1 [Anaerolineae bacterium]